MENRFYLAPRDKCTGCGACADSCTKDCITMEYRDSIHKYPKIKRDVCVSCCMCMKKCPAINHQEPIARAQNYYMAWHDDEEERMTSTSGGIGVAIMEWVIEKGWYVCGAVLDNDFELKHIITKNVEEAKLLKGSKYIQSDTSGIYKKIKDLTQIGEKVLFIGTPCQVEGLNCFLAENNLRNVITCGIICHGVNSPMVWKDYKSWIECQNGSTLKDYRFRSKSHGWQKKKGGPNLRVAYSFANGKSIDQPAWMNLFHSWFGHHYILRPSCLNCDYRREYRNSDLTIGDFWGIEKISNDVDTNKGVSVVITSTEKGESLIRECRNIHLEEVDSEKSKRVLRGFVENLTEEQRLRQIEREKQFEKEYIEGCFESMIKKYPSQTYLSRAINIIKVKLRLR